MSLPLSESDNINFDEIINHDMAIRRFCPERMDQEPQCIESLIDFDTIIAASHDFLDEDLSFIDSIINTSLCQEEVGGNNGYEVGNYIEDTTSPANSSVDKGLELVHLLLACAEAVGCRDINLASSTLGKIWPLANPNGDSLQRVSYYFAMGLSSRLSLLQNIGASGCLVNGGFLKNNSSCYTCATKDEKMDAFHHLYQTTPYICFGFMVANDAIFQASKGKNHLHIVDLGMSHTLQWPGLIQALSSRPEGPPNIKITGIPSSIANVSEINSNMQSLIDEASSVNMHVEFHMATEPFTSESLNTRKEETLFFNSILHLHKYVKESRGSLKSILVAIKKLKPKLFTVVEQDANHNGPFFLARFLESVHYYSAMFDSIEGSLPRPSVKRMMIEKCYLGEEIKNIVACEGEERVERHERADQWRRHLGRAGFQGVSIDSMDRVKMLASNYGCDGYTVGSEKGCLSLGWKGKSIIWASAWQVNLSSSS